MKLLLVGEGKTDCGSPEPGGWAEGPVQVYIRRIRTDPVEILTVHKAELRGLRSTKRQSKALKGLKGHSVKAFLIAQAAVENGCEAAVMYLDADKPEAPGNERSCRLRYEELKRQILEGFHRIPSVSAAAAVPVKMIECWMLGDGEAFRKCFRKVPGGEKYFRNPELLWGSADDPASNYPKHVLRRALAECGRESCRETFVELAERADIDTLRGTCPISFDDFYLQIRAL